MSFSPAFSSSQTVFCSPDSSRALSRHSITHFPHPVHFFLSSTGISFSICIAFWGQIFTHQPQPVHFSWFHKSSLAFCWLSGLWHHAHRRGHPLKKMEVRIPSPSWIEYFWMSNIVSTFVALSFIYNIEKNYNFTNLKLYIFFFFFFINYKICCL